MDYRPEGYPAISPYLILDDPEETMAFAEALFGGQRLRIHKDELGRIRHAEIRIGDAVIMIGGSMPGWPAIPAHLHFYLPDVDAIFARAQHLGASIVQQPERCEDGDYRGGFADPGGVTWWVASQTCA